MSDKKVDEDFSLCKEKILLLIVDPNNSSNILVRKKNDKELLAFDFNPKASTTLNQSAVNFLKDQNFKTSNLKLICVLDKIIEDSIFRVYFDINKSIALDDKNSEFKYVSVKSLTSKNNPFSDLHLNIFLKIFSDLDLIKYFKD